MPNGLTIAAFSQSILGFVTAFFLAVVAKLSALAQLTVPSWAENTFAGLFIASLIYAVVQLWRELKLTRQQHIDALEHRLEQQDTKITKCTDRIEKLTGGEG